MTLVVRYPSKKDFKTHVGEPLKYEETSHFGNEYKRDGMITVANRPHITGLGREFFAQVWMEDGKIVKVT